MATLFGCLRGLLRGVFGVFRGKSETYLFGIRNGEAEHLIIVYFACGGCGGCDRRVPRKRVNFDSINAFSLANFHGFEIDSNTFLVRLSFKYAKEIVYCKI